MKSSALLSHFIYSGISNWLLSRCIMAAIRGGANANKPCPICLVDGEDMGKFLEQYVMRTTDEARLNLENAKLETTKEQQNEVLKVTGLRPIANAFWDIENSDPY
jgi:hypothetical protein